MVIGHAAILAYFDRAREHGDFAHTYCFVGPDQVGKRTVARHLATQLLGKDDAHLATHPDFTSFEREVDVKTGKLKKDLTVAQGRVIKHRLEQRPWLGGYQVAIINEVELLNEEAANALLKTLEEPAQKTIIFLLTENDQVLLPTIRSRSQLVYFSPVSEDIVVKGLVARGVTEELAHDVAKLAQGRPGRAIALAENDDQRQAYYIERQRFEKMLRQPFYERVAAVTDVLDDKDSESRSRERVVEMFDLWALFWRDLMLNQSGIVTANTTTTTERTPSEIAAIITHLERAKRELRYNANTRLVLENVLLTF